MAQTRVTEGPICYRVEAAVRAVLPRSVKLRASGRDSAVDMILNGKSVQAKWLGEGGLRQVREVIDRRRNHPDVVVARRISPGAREALAEAGIGWIDESGAAEIVLGPIIVSRSGRPDVARAKSARWTPSVLAVAEALLCGGKATVLSMQEATGLSSGACTQGLQVLVRLGLLSSAAARGRASARQVIDTNQLVEAYAAAVAAMPPPIGLRAGVTWQDTPSGLRETGKRWDKAGIFWAATGAVAASVMAPYLTLVTGADVYIDAETIAGLDAAAVTAGLRPIEGGRLTLRPFPTVTTRRLTETKADLRLAPWPRVYADLRPTGVRSEEAAEHLREFVNGK